MSTEHAPQVETQAAPAVNATQQATTPTENTQRVKNPKRVAAGKMVAERTQLAREEPKKAAKASHTGKEAKAATEAPEPAPTTEGESPKKRAAGSAPTNGSLLAAWALPYSCPITHVKSSRQWPSPRSTNSKRRSPHLSP